MAPIPLDEEDRLRVLRDLRILDTVPEERFDRLTRIATAATRTPVALVSLVDSNRQWLKSRVGFDVCQTSRSVSFCAYVVHSREPLIIEDARLDTRTADLANVTGEPGIRAYAGFPMLASSGHCLGSFCILDFKPRIFTEDELNILRDLAAAAESELTNLDKNQLIADLALANDLAQRATIAQRRLTAVVGHEIRNALNGIVGVTELLDANVPISDHARVLSSSSRSLMALINDLLDYCKISEDRLQLNPQPTDLRALATEVMEVIRLRVPEAVTVDFDCHEEVSEWVITDELRVRQILLNLLGNAAKFTRKGRIHLAIREAAAPMGAWEFEISDTGEGIDAASATQLFEPFHQADATVAARVGGTGLGLTISQRLIEQMGGTIRFESEKGVGSTFTFTLLARPCALPARTLPAEVPDLSAESLRILVAEDDPINQRLLGAMLKKLGHAATFLTSGHAVIEHADQPDAWDVILMDVGLADLDGLVAARTIRERETGTNRPAVPIIAITADATEESRQACLAAGMTDFLPKPITILALRQALIHARR